MARTTTRKRPAAKKRTTTKRKTAATKAPAKIAAAREVRSKSQVFTTLSEATGVAKRDVAAVFDAMAVMIGADLKSGPGEFRVPGMMKIVVQKKPATKARKGVNPFTGETMMFKAKPARKIVKVRPLKGLKEMV